jgi:hypothetical protein
MQVLPWHCGRERLLSKSCKQSETQLVNIDMDMTTESHTAN